MANAHDTLIVNMFSGPGAGKSTTAAGLFSELKLRGIRAEYVPEFAKGLVWQKRQFEFSCQPYIIGNQLWMIESLIGQVKVVVTDSPILLGAIYDDGKRHPAFQKFVLEQFKSMHNFNIYLNRVKPYDPVGRNQDEDGAKDIDDKVFKYLLQNHIEFTSLNGDRDAIRFLADWVEEKVA